MPASGDISQPLVSILMPTYNQQQFVESSIRSCLNQSYENIEIVISDDASTDGTWNIVADFAKAHPGKIIATRQSRNLGVSRNCNFLLPQCKGKYLALFAGDDLMYPNKIAKQVQTLELCPDVAICAHDVHLLDDVGEVSSSTWANRTLQYDGTVSVLFQHLCFTCGCSLLVRRNCVPETGYEEILVASDWLLFAEILIKNNHRLVCLADVLGAYRRRPGQLTSKCDSSALANYLDHAFACGLLLAKYPEFRHDIAIGLKNWKSAFTRELEANAIWNSELTTAQLASPHWLFRRLLTTSRDRIRKLLGV
ncbi:MAG: glycosyltransferase [Planctomycetaceae bacterium]|nr:glycosyltransferase [Planctomycetales bacterium]MCB9922485.1 glycosyltransferase [Planctomycetaceae bacterium]